MSSGVLEFPALSHIVRSVSAKVPGQSPAEYLAGGRMLTRKGCLSVATVAGWPADGELEHSSPDIVSHFGHQM